MTQDSDDAKPKGLRRFAADDMFAGFDREGRPEGLRAFFASTIGASLFAWDIAFTLGAYHTVFYYRLFQILVVSTVLLLGTIVLRRTVTVQSWTRVVLAIPLLWLLARLVAPFGRGSDADHILDLVLIGCTVASVPFIILALMRIMAPDYFALPGRQLKIAAVVITLLVSADGFCVGQFNFRFTTCEQYNISGDNPPANCRHAPLTTRHLP